MGFDWKAMSEPDVLQWCFPHMDYGNCQMFVGDYSGLKHGDVVERESINRINGVEVSRAKSRSTFRLIEAGLYEKEFYEVALPIAKKCWNVKLGRFDCED